MSKPSLVFAANRRLGFEALRLLVEADWTPDLLVVTRGRRADHVEEMKALLPGVPVIEGKRFREAEGLSVLQEIQPDYILSVHFPYIVPPEVLALPRIGTLNLHPAYLPYNRGWHTPSWALLEGTPYGATLHWMDEGVDTGPIAMQRRLVPAAHDTADSLYQRVLELELELFAEAIAPMAARTLPREPQQPDAGTEHKMNELAVVQCLDLEKRQTIGETLMLLRGLTTNAPSEAAYFSADDGDYWVQVSFGKRESDQ